MTQLLILTGIAYTIRSDFLNWLSVFMARKRTHSCSGRPIPNAPMHLGLLNPKFLPAWCIVGVLYLFSLTSLALKVRLGKKLGPYLARKMRSRAKVGIQNIKACFPELSDKAVHERMVGCMTHMTIGALEGPHAWWRDMQPHADAASVIGIEHLMEAHKKGNGVLIMGGHFAAVDFILPIFAAKVVDQVDLGYMYRPHNNPVIDRMIVNGRGRHGVTGFTKKQLKDMVAYISEGGMVWYGCDQDFGKHADLFVPFFGVPASNISTPSYIARETGAAVVFMGMRRLENGQYEFEFSPELPQFGQDAQKDAEAWNQELEKSILKFPSQYFWVHKRFKKRPPGEPNFYS